MKRKGKTQVFFRGSFKNLDDFVALLLIEYVEKPKGLFFAVNQGRTAPCFSAPDAP